LFSQSSTGVSLLKLTNMRAYVLSRVRTFRVSSCRLRVFPPRLHRVTVSALHLLFLFWVFLYLRTTYRQSLPIMLSILGSLTA
jgi:hypothetical protein